MTNTISAAANPALANQMLNKALTETPKERMPEIVSPSDTTVELPGGYINAAGEVIRTAEVRELTGKDEEIISKTNNLGKAILTILQLGTVKIGNEPSSDKLLDELLVGDRDAILLGIIKATFGTTAKLPIFSDGEQKFVEIDLNNDIKTKFLTDPVNERMFIVKGKTVEYTVKLPNGVVQREMINNADKTPAELSTLVLENTLVRIGENPVYSKAQVQALSVVDRRTIIEEINKRAPGPQFEDIVVTDPDTGSEVTVPINLGSLFQF
jgi:hypothetical protein